LLSELRWRNGRNEKVSFVGAERCVETCNAAVSNRS
jgi:hypothetical protein